MARSGRLHAPRREPFGLAASLLTNFATLASDETRHARHVSRDHAIWQSGSRCSRLPDAGADSFDDLVRTVIRRVGPRWRTRDGFHRPLSPDCLPDCAAGGGPGAARFAGAAADGHADGSLRRTPRLHGAPRLLLSRRLRRAADRQLRLAPRRGVPRRHGRVVVRSGRGLRISLDPGSSPGHRPRRLRPGDNGSVACCLCRTGRRRPLWLGSSLSRHERAAACLGGGATSSWRGIPRSRAVPLPSPP